MRRTTNLLTVITLLAASLFLSCSSSKNEGTKTGNETGLITENEDEEEGYDGPAEMARREWELTKDPALDRVPRERLMTAVKYADNLRSIYARITTAGTWIERGPNSDTVGASNGNTRANSGIAAGRIRAVLIDAADATGNTVWIGGVNGGLWKTTDISASPATWVPQSDFFTNMSITSICQNPVSPSTMYFATGEWVFNVDAVAGDGIWKTTNGGVTWTQLASTTSASFDYCSKILCDAAGNVYVSTRSGIFRSTDGGTTWTTITPTGMGTSRFSDMELSSTGRLHVSAGVFSTCGYRYTDNPSTVTTGAWTSPVSGYPSSSVRIELGCSGNTLYALPSDGTYQVPILYKSTDGGANWTTINQPASNWASQQAWYSMAIDVDPANDNNLIVGGLESYKSTDAGLTWTKLATWVGTSGQYVHADIHFIDWYSSNRIIFGCDGGIHYTSDGGTTIRDRNVGLRIKQFYSCDVHPTDPNYFLAGAQDNGSHRFRTAGLAGTTEVTGGDGAFVHIDQDQPQYQFTSYVYNQYRRSTNGGANWSSVNFSSSQGQFINPTDYDDAANVMYCANTSGTYRRWTDPQTGSSNAAVTIPELNSSSVLAVTVSPYTSNRVYFGTAGGRVVAVDNANTIASGSNGTNLSTGLPASSVSCIAVGTSDNFLMASYSNYGVNQVNVSTDGGASWTNIDGNLPDMPVRWCMFYPGDNTKAIIATEAGVWITELVNGAITSWYVSSTFPLVRTDMIKYQASTNQLVAATHGRGLWTQSAATVLPLTNLSLSGAFNSDNQVSLNWSYEPASSNTRFEVQVSTDGKNFTKAADVAYNGTRNYKLSSISPASKVFYRIRAIEYNEISRYSNTIKLDRNAGRGQITTQLSPNPVASVVMLQYSAGEKGQAVFTILNASGKAVITRQENIVASGAYAKPWDISRLSPGIYTLVMRLNNAQASQKFVKN